MLRSRSPSRPFLAALALLAVCSAGAVARAQSEQPTSTQAAVDPVSAAVTEASRRFGVPEHWIRSVMRVESAGRIDAVSRAGAMGLMQVMPGTYAELRARHGLGPDPFAIRDNVLAGTAYLREMFDRYGATGMLAAYNAGPGRWEAHVAGVRPLPAETVGYLARLGPVLDIAAIPTPPTRIASSAPSPLEAPIFVVLHSGSAARSSSAGSPAMRTVIAAANTTVVPASGELFVRRLTSTEMSQPTPGASDAVPNGSASDLPPTTTDSAARGPVNPLFPARSGQDER